jgi:hypothetical protein
MRRIVILALALVVFAVARLDSQTQPPETSYKVLKKIELGGEGGWDYLTIDPEARRLYIPRGSHTMVMDLETNKVVGDIPNTKGVHGVALAVKHKKGFTSNGGDSTVTIFDLETIKEVSQVKVGAKPDAITYDPFTDCVFTFNAGSSDATAIAAESGKVLGTVKLGGRPEAGVSDEKGMIYVNIVDKNEIVAFDAKQLMVKNRWPVAPGTGPTGLAIDPAKRRLFCTCKNEKVVILDADSGKVLGSPTIGKGTDACVFDSSVGLAFSSNKDGTLTVIGEDKEGKFRDLANVTTMAGAKTMALDAKTHNIYLATAQFKDQGGKSTPVPNTFTIVIVGR